MKRAPVDWLESYRQRAAKVRAENERARQLEARQAAEVEALLVPRNALQAWCRKKTPYHPRSFGRIIAGARAAGRVSLFDSQFKWWWLEMRFAALLSPAQQRHLSGALCRATRGGWDEGLSEQYIGADGLLVDQWPDKWPGSTRLSDLAEEMAGLPRACVRWAFYGATCDGTRDGEACEARCGVEQSNVYCCQPGFVGGYGDWASDVPAAPWYVLEGA